MNMIIDWAHFTPWASLAGGILIGAAASVLILLNGKIAGISGILGSLLRPVQGDIGWRIAFLAALILSPYLFTLFAPLPVAIVSADSVMFVIAGLLVGFGTRLGKGCTSGHGVCGLSRGSLRSLVATASFMLAGFVTVYLMRHWIN